MVTAVYIQYSFLIDEKLEHEVKFETLYTFMWRAVQILSYFKNYIIVEANK